MNPWRGRRIARGLAFILFAGILSLGLQAGTNISHSSDTESYGPRVTVDASGNVYAIWLEKYSDTTGDIFYAKLSKSSGSWSTPQNISQSGKCCTNVKLNYREADIACDGSGNIYAIWAEYNIVKLRALTGGSWDSIFTLYSGSGVSCPILDVTDGGDIFTTWTAGWKTWSRARINGNWEAAKQVSTASGACKNGHIAVGSSQVYAVWMQKTSADYRIFWSKRGTTLNAAWSAGAMIYNGPYAQVYPAVKVDSSDVAHAVYMDEQAEGVRTAQYCVKSGSGFASPVTISATSGLHYTSMSIQSTNIYAQWQCGPWSNGQAIRYNMKLSGSWSGENAVPGSGGCTYGDIEADSTGKVHFVYDSNGEVYYYLLGSAPPPPPRLRRP